MGQLKQIVRCLFTEVLRFRVAMETCLVRTNGAIKRLEQLHNATVKEFNKVAQYFGENPKNIGMQQFFKIFDEFTRKFLVNFNAYKIIIVFTLAYYFLNLNTS